MTLKQLLSLTDKGDGNQPTLDWNSRLKVALGSARGLTYLHHDCCPKIIHRDIKSSNILLDENLEPRVSDFGLAKLVVDEDAHVTTVVAGTFGYLAPGMYAYIFTQVCIIYLCIHLLSFFGHQNTCKVEEQPRRLMCIALEFYC